MAVASEDEMRVHSPSTDGTHPHSDAMNDVAPRVRVVAAVIERQGRYLITQRSSAVVLAGLWEFPNCKVETGETDEAALRRELLERVGIDVDVGAAAASRAHRYDGYVVDLVLYQASVPSNQEPSPVRVADLRWVRPQELENYSFPAADQSTTDLLLGINSHSRSEPFRTESLLVRG